MKVVLDTNVLVSGIFFAGPPARILEAWRDGQVLPVLSTSILDEYRRVGLVLAGRYPAIDLEPFLALLTVHSEVVEVQDLPEPVSEDPDDDKFLACAIAAGARVVVSGDRHLLRVSGWSGVEVVSPRGFVERFLGSTSAADG